MSRDSRELYHKLSAVESNEAATDGERAQAREYMRRLVDKHGDAVRSWGHASFTPESAAEVQLVLHSAATHGCKVRHEAPRIHVEGGTDAVARVSEDYRVYAPHLRDILQVTMIAALKGFGVYCDDPRGHEGKTQESKPAFPYDVRRHVEGLFHAAGALGRRFMRPDYSRKQLPAPKPQERANWKVQTGLPDRFARLIGATEIGGRTMAVRAHGPVDDWVLDAILGKNR